MAASSTKRLAWRHTCSKESAIAGLNLFAFGPKRRLPEGNQRCSAQRSIKLGRHAGLMQVNGRVTDRDRQTG